MNSIKVYGKIKETGSIIKPEQWHVIPTEEGDDLIVNISQNKIEKFRFATVFGKKSTQHDVFAKIAIPLITNVLEGYNATIFAYGKTGSGKTYSIIGERNHCDQGLTPRAVAYILNHIKNDITIRSSTVSVSFVEIYKEVAFDLLKRNCHTSQMKDLPRVKVFHDLNGEINFRNLNVAPVASEEEAMELLSIGNANRTVAETEFNSHSSRSHSIFTIYVTTTMSDGGAIRQSKLHLVDLAGSERLLKSASKSSSRLDSKKINLSLYHLERVINSLSDTRNKKIHVPYRDSLITNILKDSLGGNCLTVMLATLSLDAENLEESISTCKFAQRVAMVSTKPIKNEVKPPTSEIVIIEDEICKRDEEQPETVNENLSEVQHQQLMSAIDKSIQMTPVPGTSSQSLNYPVTNQLPENKEDEDLEMYLKNIFFTGDSVIDNEIYSFYKSRNINLQKKKKL